MYLFRIIVEYVGVFVFYTSSIKLTSSCFGWQSRKYDMMVMVVYFGRGGHPPCKQQTKANTRNTARVIIYT